MDTIVKLCIFAFLSAVVFFSAKYFLSGHEYWFGFIVGTFNYAALDVIFEGKQILPSRRRD